MNEETSSIILSDQGDVLVDSSSDPALDQFFETETLETETMETVEVIGEVVEERLFLSTPFDDYTVTEGLLLMILFALIIPQLIRIVKGGFFWLL